MMKSTTTTTTTKSKPIFLLQINTKIIIQYKLIIIFLFFDESQLASN